MKKKKRAFHCQRCGKECTIYKKGTKHRVLVCPQCGVLATNPIVQVEGLKNLIDSRGNIFQAVEDTAVSFIPKSKKNKNTEMPEKIYIDNLDKPNRGERTINQELYGV